MPENMFDTQEALPVFTVISSAEAIERAIPGNGRSVGTRSFRLQFPQLATDDG
ncbi:MAG: hypothetical protein NTY25_01205 [Planctomycetia bacterium]|nr:hypothetical protein [Planctomycetia bacterium]